MSDLSAALGVLGNTGLEFYAVSQGQPLTVSQTVAGGVPISTSSVGNVVQPGSIGTLAIVAIIVLVGIYVLRYIR